MTTPASLLELYERLHALYLDMRAAAQRNEWDALTELEHTAGSLRLSIQQTSAELSDADGARVAALIRETLTLDEEIRSHVDPFLESTRKLLSGAVRDNNVRKAYGAFGP